MNTRFASLHLSLVCGFLFYFAALSAHALTFLEAQRNGFGLTTGLNGASGVVVTADGQFVYTSAFFDDSVAIFSRDASSGRLTFIAEVKNNTGGIDGIDGANGLALSPDDAFLYVAGLVSSAVAVFQRDASGGLSFVQVLKDEVNGGSGLGAASAVAVSPDGSKVYVTGAADNAITVFTRDNANGQLSNPVSAVNGSNGISGMGGAGRVTVSPDNAHVYVAGSTDSALVIFDSNLNFQSALVNNGTISGLSGVSDVAVSPDGAFVYTVSNGDNSLAVFSRAAGSGALTFVASYQDNVNNVDGLSGGRAVATSKNGQVVYALGSNESAIAEFQVQPGGTLSFVSKTQNGSNGVSGIGGASSVAISPNDEQVYVTGLNDDGIGVFSTVSADLDLTVTTPSPVAIDTNFNYTLTLANNGPDPASAIQIVHTLPTGVNFVASSDAQACAHAAGTVTCNVSSLAVGSSTSFTVTATTPSTGIYNTVAEVSANQPDPSIANNTARASTTVLVTVIKSDLAVTINDNVTAVNVGALFSYTINAVNNGPDPTGGVVVTHTLPPTAVFGSVEPFQQCAYNASAHNVVCNLGTLNASASSAISVVLRAPASPEVLSSSVTISGTEIDDDSTNNQSSDTTSVERITVDMAITAMTASAATVNAGQTLTYDLAFANAGTQTASNVILTHTFSPEGGANYVSSAISAPAAPSPGSPCVPTVPGVISCSVGTLNPGESGSLQLVVLPVLSGALTNTATLSSDFPENNPGNESAAVSATVTGTVADLAVTIVDSPSPVLSNATVTYTVNVINNGPGTATGVTVNHNISGTGIIVGTAQTSVGICGGGRSFSCDLGDIASGQAVSVAVPVIAGDPGTISYTVTAQQTGNAFDPGAPNETNKVTAVSSVSTDISVGMTASPNPALLGRTLSYTVTVANVSTLNAQNVVLTNTLPSSVGFVSALSEQGACVEAAGTVSCNLGSVAGSQSVPVIIKVVPQQSGSLNNTVEVSTGTFDPVVANNSATLGVQVREASADIQVTIQEAADPVSLGGNVIHTATVINAGPDPATNVTLTSVLPASATLVSATSGQGTGCVDVNKILTCNLGSMNSDTSTTVSFVFTPANTGIFSSSVTVTADQLDTSTPNTAAVDTQVTELQTVFFVNDLKNGIGGIQGLGGATALALSPDDNNVYAVGFRDHGIAVFARDPTSGNLTFLQSILNGQDGISGLGRASNVAVSDDGSVVYVTGFADNSLVVFNRDQSNGRLNFSQIMTDGNGGVSGLIAPFGLATRGSFVYTASIGSHAVSVFKREAGSGQLQFVEVHQGLPSMKAVNAVEISPDGSQLYAAAFEGNSLLVFDRNASTGTLAFSHALQSGIGGVSGLGGANSVAISGDGQFIYASGSSDNAVAIFQRQATGTLNFIRSVTTHPGLNGVSSLALSSDGLFLFTAGTNDNTMGVFKRNPDSGELTFNTAISDGSINSGLTVNGLAGVRDLAISRQSGGHIYAVGLNDDAVAVFRTAAAEIGVTLEADQAVSVVDSELLYTVTVTNNGPDSASGVVLTSKLPEGVTLVAATPSQGPACTSDAVTLVCRLGALNNTAEATVFIIVKPNREGSLSHAVSVVSSEYDPILPNTASIITDAVGVADLVVSMRDETDPVPVNGSLVYRLQVTNTGPNTATDVVVTDSLPLTVQYVNAQASQGVCTQNVGVVTCSVGTLEPTQSSNITLEVIPTQNGTLLNTVEAVARQNDPVSPNTYTEATNVVTNIISGAYDNTGQVLANHAISSTGSVTGGSVDGLIVNQGRLQDVTILPGATVVGGGILEGTIVNQGTIKDATLAPNTSISGGIVSGVIIGPPDGNALISSQIADGTELSYVLIDSLSQLGANVIIGAGVRFATDVGIPAGADLTAAMRFIQEPVSGALALNLAYDVVVNGGSLLDGINALEGLQAFGVSLVQLSNGHIWVRIGNIDYTAIPLQLKQAPLGTPPGIVLNSDNSLIFTTANGRQIFAQPALRDMPALQTALSLLGLPRVRAQQGGNLAVFTSDGARYVARPDLKSYVAEVETGPNSFTVQAAELPGITWLRLMYLDHEGELRQQALYPSPANPAALLEALHMLPAATDIRLESNGWFSLKIGTLVHRGVFDYRVVPGTPPGSGVTQFVRTQDANHDGIEDFIVVFPNGDRQVMYYLPPPPATAEIHLIPVVQNGGYTVTIDDSGHILMQAGSLRYYLVPGIDQQLAANTPPDMILNADGSITFITPTARRFTAHPVVQNYTALLGGLATFGFDKAAQSTEGNLFISGSGNVRWAVRPARASNLTTLPVGLHEVSSPISGLNWLQLVFNDETGTRRSQLLYPATVDHEAVFTFFDSAPGTGKTVFYNDGSFEVSGSNLNFRASFSHVLTPGGAGGNLQFTESGDANGDGLPDFVLSYENGLRQIVYRR